MFVLKGDAGEIINVSEKMISIVMVSLLITSLALFFTPNMNPSSPPLILQKPSSPSTVKADVAPWWNTSFHYRIPVNILVILQEKITRTSQ